MLNPEQLHGFFGDNISKEWCGVSTLSFVGVGNESLCDWDG